MYVFISFWSKCKNGICGNYVKSMIWNMLIEGISMFLGIISYEFLC